MMLFLEAWSKKNAWHIFLTLLYTVLFSGFHKCSKHILPQLSGGCIKNGSYGSDMVRSMYWGGARTGTSSWADSSLSGAKTNLWVENVHFLSESSHGRPGNTVCFLFWTCLERLMNKHGIICIYIYIWKKCRFSLPQSFIFWFGFGTFPCFSNGYGRNIVGVYHFVAIKMGISPTNLIRKNRVCRRN